MTREIPLTKGYIALVDDGDYLGLSAHRWQALCTKSGRVYAKRTERRAVILMHREIMDAAPGVKIDHIEGVGLDNQRANLRPATHQQNLCNRRRSVSRSGYMGVVARKSRWLAYVSAHGKQTFVGSFAGAEEAARARDAAARELHGEFAFQNFPAGAGEDRRSWGSAGTMGAQKAGRVGSDR